MFGIHSARSRSNLSRSSANNHNDGNVAGTSSIDGIDYDELEALYEITRGDVRRFGARRFRSLCKREGPEVAARTVGRELRPSSHHDTGVLDEADVWVNNDGEVEVVLGATF